MRISMIFSSVVINVLITHLNRWKFQRTLLADGNFKQEHLKMKNPSDDVPLSDGHGYMVTKQDFQLYLKNTPAPPPSVRLSSLSALTIINNPHGPCRNPPAMSMMLSRIKIRLVHTSMQQALVRLLVDDTVAFIRIQW